MNARTNRLLARVARAMWLKDPTDPRPPESARLAQLKTAWQRTPPDQRERARQGLVAIFNELMGGRSA